MADWQNKKSRFIASVPQRRPVSQPPVASFFYFLFALRGLYRCRGHNPRHSPDLGHRPRFALPSARPNYGLSGCVSWQLRVLRLRVRSRFPMFLLIAFTRIRRLWRRSTFVRSALPVRSRNALSCFLLFFYLRLSPTFDWVVAGQRSSCLGHAGFLHAILGTEKN